MRPCLSSSHSTAAERYIRRKATTFGSNCGMSAIFASSSSHARSG